MSALFYLYLSFSVVVGIMVTAQNWGTRHGELTAVFAGFVVFVAWPFLATWKFCKWLDTELI